MRNLVQYVEQIIPAVSDQNFLSRINYRTLSVIVKEWDMGGENWSTQIRDVSRLWDEPVTPRFTLMLRIFPTNLSRKRNCGRPRHRDGPNWRRSYVRIRVHKLFGIRFKIRLERKWLSTTIPVTEIPDKD